MSVFIHSTQDEHMRVREDIVNFTGENKDLFSVLIIDPKGKMTIESKRRPKEWASQVEIQAAVKLYDASGGTSPFFSEICTFFFVPVITFPPFLLCK